MADNKEAVRPHLPFRKMDLERARKKLGPAPRIKRENYVDHGNTLIAAVRVLKNDFEEIIRETPPEFDPALIFRITIEGGQQVSEEDWRKSGLTLLSEESGNVAVLFSPDQLAEFATRIGRFSEKKEEDQTTHYGWIASLTAKMNLWGRNDRIGKKLSKVEIVRNEEYVLDVELWYYGTDEDIHRRMGELRSFIENNRGKFLDFYIGSSLSVARVKIIGDALNHLLEVGIVEKVDLPPQPDFQIGQLISTPLDDFPNPVSSPEESAPGICVIDSGISSGHPMLGPAIGETLPIPASLGTGLDENGHGTRVSGIALYGDVQGCIQSLNFTPEFFLFGARVTNSNNSFDDERLIVNQMDEAIRYYHREYNCRIFNISLADPALIYDGGKPSTWAQILDILVRELNILIIVSAGNYRGVVGANGDRADYFQQNYPRYLLDPEARILEPATAANVLTVGSLAHTASPRDMVRYPNDPAIRCVAETDEPSPFTCRGPGVNDSIKPDVCEYGGNATWNGHLRRILENDSNVGIVSTHHKFVERLFTVDIGTSYAAPKVAYLAGKILKSYPDISANLMRVLIANSARVPVGLFDKLDQDEILKLCGYGRPDLERAIYSTNNRVTLIADDNILLDTFHIYQIPIPEAFKQTDGKRSITVSLAFDPPVRHTRKGYLGIKMSYYLLRGISTERVIENYEARPKDSKIDELEGKYDCQMSPSIRKRSGGTLQKATWTASLTKPLLQYEGDVFHLVVLCKALPWISKDEVDRQQYALAVTLEHSEGPIDLYNVIEQRVRPEQRVRVR
jgi:hypothetical protein